MDYIYSFHVKYFGSEDQLAEAHEQSSLDT